jgi:hypothetical protein
MWKLQHCLLEIDFVYDVRLPSNCTGSWDRAMSYWPAMLLTCTPPLEDRVRNFHLKLFMARL